MWQGYGIALLLDGLCYEFAMDSPVRRTVAAIGLQSVQFQCNHTNHIAILCSFAIQLQSSLVVSIGLDGMDCTSNWERLIAICGYPRSWVQSFDHLAILPQSNLIAVRTGVPRQPVDCIDCGFES